MKIVLMVTMIIFYSLSSDKAEPNTPPSTPIPSRRNSNKVLKRQASQEDIEKALHEIEKLKKNKSCCKITRPQVALISSAISTVTTAAITIATMYANCDVKKTE